MNETPGEGSSELDALHRAVDQAAVLLETSFGRAHGYPVACAPGCSGCCVDEITVFEIEARTIRAHHAVLLDTGVPGPVGACAFLDTDGRCRVYEQRPYVCRTQGLPLRWLEPYGEGGGFEYRDVCKLNEHETGVPLVELAPELFWTLGPWESKLRLLQELRDGGEGRRVALRDLWNGGGQARPAPSRMA